MAAASRVVGQFRQRVFLWGAQLGKVTRIAGKKENARLLPTAFEELLNVEMDYQITLSGYNRNEAFEGLGLDNPTCKAEQNFKSQNLAFHGLQDGCASIKSS
ncbi:hypothetical protein C5167_005225 [Papaver somniferum]|uniref:Uncharacterized protein n=1 Tax=Papaver somniferum TaxID=3469 RepID=A0A4Y7JAU0_PAPSO|nr:hypothetical protein C5167_005225 [Papaver somniferum]